ncbi:MAG: hypothetical protein JWP95_1585 [Actinotalea sp.]|jgi:hypothetical protein|nr:hypothetical protein [Actinotalea sp.]
MRNTTTRLTSQRCSFERGLVDGGDWGLLVAPAARPSA